jgi:energy-coupling factor transporter ATP-binding protein EcfA2
LENLGLTPQQTHEQVDAALARFGLRPLRTRSPTTLSGGEQQKLALAAIMAREPMVLVLDEPFSMLDSTAVEALVDDLRALARSDVTMVVCEHRPEPLQAIPGLRPLRLRCRATDETAETCQMAAIPELHLTTTAFELTVQGLSVELGGREILRDLSFQAHGGEIIAVVGRNGVGKTTLLRTLAGLQPYQGMIAVDGERPDLGMVFQNADLQLFNASVREEVLYRVGEPDLSLYRQLLDALALARYEAVPPLLLSEGEKKRVALATVLMRRPRHGVLLDEPALGQDGAHKQMLMHIARALAQSGQLVIMTTHDLTLAGQADRMLLLGEEGFVADGPPTEVLRHPAPWAAIGLSVPSWLQIPAQAEATT